MGDTHIMVQNRWHTPHGTEQVTHTSWYSMGDTLTWYSMGDTHKHVMVYNNLQITTIFKKYRTIHSDSGDFSKHAMITKGN